jgi:flagellar biosynthetic protein FlhB
MSEQAGDKTELPTQKKLDEAFNKGQIARSPEVQTAAVLMGGLMAMMFTGHETWRIMSDTMTGVFRHLHNTPLTVDALQGYAVSSSQVFGNCVWPVVSATVLAGLLAGGLQTRFKISPEALGFNPERLSPIEGFKRIFSFQRGAVSTLISATKLTVIIALSYGAVKNVMSDPIFHSSVSVARIAGFMADSSFKIVTRVAGALVVLAAADYGYQFWKHGKDLMMTKQEVKDEAKSQEANAQVKTAQRRRRRAGSKRKMLAEVPKADVVIVNPTHIAIALKYDRKTMRAPKIVAKGIRMNAQQIRDIAKEHQVPVIENVPLARLLFKYGKVGGEIPAELYAAVAEVLAWVYRVNAYRYYREQNG